MFETTLGVKRHLTKLSYLLVVLYLLASNDALCQETEESDLHDLPNLEIDSASDSSSSIDETPSHELPGFNSNLSRDSTLVVVPLNIELPNPPILFRSGAGTYRNTSRMSAIATNIPESNQAGMDSFLRGYLEIFSIDNLSWAKENKVIVSTLMASELCLHTVAIVTTSIAIPKLNNLVLNFDPRLCSIIDNCSQIEESMKGYRNSSIAFLFVSLFPRGLSMIMTSSLLKSILGNQTEQDSVLIWSNFNSLGHVMSLAALGMTSVGYGFAMALINTLDSAPLAAQSGANEATFTGSTEAESLQAAALICSTVVTAPKLIANVIFLGRAIKNHLFYDRSISRQNLPSPIGP